MKKRILFAMLLATTSLLVACGSTSTQDNQEVQNTQETTNQEVVSTQEDVVQEDMEGKTILVNDGWKFDFEYITSKEMGENDYKIYFDVLENQVVDDAIRFQVFEEYRPNESSNTDEKEYRHVLVQFTTPNETSMMIDIPHSEWDFSTCDIMDKGLRYRPQNEGKRFEEITFVIEDISNEDNLLSECANGENLDKAATWFLYQNDYYKLTQTNPKTAKYEYNEEDNYAKIVYKTDFKVACDENIYDCFGYSCVHEDYETMKRIIILYGLDKDSTLPVSGDTKDMKDFLDDYIVIVDKGYHFTKSTFVWTFPQGEGETQKTPMANGMSINVTSYNNSDNQEMKFHWYGPETLGEQARVEENGLLTLNDKDENYRLNVQQIPLSECEAEIDRDEDDALIIGENDKIFSPLQEYEHYVEGSVVDCSINNHGYGMYPITTDDGYKGYAYIMYGSRFRKPNDEVYFITYVEKESIYDDERTLEVIKSIDYHLGIE